MGIYLGTGAVSKVYLGASEVSKIYLGTDLIFDNSGGGGYTLFDNGWTGVEWTGNALPRPQYTSIASYSFGNVESDGYMTLTIASQSSYSNVYHNCHVCTNGLITVPAGATKMCVSCKQHLSGTPNMTMKFGLLTSDCVNSMDATNGGQLSELITLSGSTEAVYEITLNSGIAGNQWIAVVNARRTAQAAAMRSLQIYKVYFE